MSFYRYIHFLSLDVCVGALAYQAYFYKLQTGMLVPINLQILLFCSIWVVYLLDRMIDVRIDLIRDERHQFIQQHQTKLLGLIGVLVLVIANSLIRLPIEWILKGTFIGLFLLFYWIAWAKKWFNRWVSKEFLTAFIYVLGIVFPFVNVHEVAIDCLLFLFFLIVLHHLKLFLHITGKKCSTFLLFVEVVMLGIFLYLYNYHNSIFLISYPLGITLGVQLIIHYFYPSVHQRAIAEMAYWSPIILFVYELF
ncbi:MAG: hypothetical protein RI995_1897 [Bacteroidota bacterium]